MSVTLGTKLGPYEIISAVGSGGMGEVYRAKDTRLDRIVAIKILPAHLSSNPDFKQRFEREARTISSLSHPYICALYDIGTQEGTDYIVMEFLEGETIAQRLTNGPLPLEQTLRYGIQIADALDKAHRQGIIHRDLKPGNIMIGKSGIKLLDFGLAKQQISLLKPSTEVSSLPTEQRDLTSEGTILGTIQYMAPEQLEGKNTDARTDIFALGSVLYEMATGKKAFMAKSQASLISAILSSEPAPVSTVQPTAPPLFDRIVKTCLAKDPEERWQNAHDIAAELKWISESSQPMIESRPTHKAKTSQWPLWLLIALIGTAAGWFLKQASGKKQSVSFNQTVRSLIPEPSGLSYNSVGDEAGPVIVSPDGKYLAFSATNTEGQSPLWIRPVDSLKVKSLSGTEEAIFPFWSADSRSIGFFAKGKLKRVDIDGGSAITLADAPTGRGGTWNRQQVIVYTPYFGEGLYQIPASGGSPTLVTKIDNSKHSTHRWPSFLPDGKHFLYLAANHDSNLKENSSIYAASLDGKENKLLLKNSANVSYSSGYLLFLRENTLVARPFDPDQLEFRGDAIPITENVAYWPWTWNGVFSVSENGLLAFQEAVPYPGSDLIWFDRVGEKLKVVSEKGIYQGVELSPDEKKLLVSIGDPSDVWIFDLERESRRRFTFQRGSNPLWSPDQNLIAYSSDQVNFGRFKLYIKPSSGAGEEKSLLDESKQQRVSDWSQDGKYILYEEGMGEATNLCLLDLNDEKQFRPFLNSRYIEMHGRFSPDGKWVAYVSDQSGRYEVYVASFASPGNKFQVSTEGGTFPRWRRDGKELFYVSSINRSTAQRFMAAQISYSASEFRVETAQKLFEVTIPPVGTPADYNYDVSSDGQRILANVTQDQKKPPITLITNWVPSVKK